MEKNQNELTTVRIRRSTLKKLRGIAKAERRTNPLQLDVIIDQYQKWQHISSSTLPHPPDGTPVPLHVITPSPEA